MGRCAAQLLGPGPLRPEVRAQAEGDDNGKRSNVTVTQTVVRQIDGNDFPTDDIMGLLRQGKKIEAIKVLMLGTCPAPPPPYSASVSQSCAASALP